MVRGIELFRSAFADFSNSYILIGGAACDVLLERAAVPFRVTHDLDIVLCVEALTPEFGRAFLHFIKNGGYQIQEKASGDKKFYRFRNPTRPEYPAMLELFSRKPDTFELASDSQLTPIPMEEEVSSLSAILLDSEYYEFIQTNRIQIDGLSLLSTEALIVLKAKAWLDLSERKHNGEHVDSKNIKKHKNDVCRLFASIAETSQLTVPVGIQSEMRDFVTKMQDEEIDLAAMRIPISMHDVLEGLRTLFNI